MELEEDGQERLSLFTRVERYRCCPINGVCYDRDRNKNNRKTRSKEMNFDGSCRRKKKKMTSARPRWMGWYFNCQKLRGRPSRPKRQHEERQ